MSLCKYKDALGEPGKGIHSYRFMGVAIADVIMTIIGALISPHVFNIALFDRLSLVRQLPENAAITLV